MRRERSVTRPAAKRWALAVLLALAGAAAAPATTLKLATLVPDGSVWDQVLKEMGAEWQRVTGGRVELRVYPGGVAGDEPDVVRKMRIGQLHAASLSVTGLSEIDPAFGVFAIPLFFDSYEELFFVVERLEPLLARRLEEKGFVLLQWGHGGWVHIFSRRPVRRLDDLKRQKIFVWAGDDRAVQTWRDNGFHPVALAATDILTGLQTGMIDALPSTPLIALSLQWFRQTPYMHELGLAPLVGATVATKRAWDRLEPADREAMLTAARAAEKRFEKEIPAQDRRAVEAMTERGLEVVTSDVPAEWREAAETFAQYVRGGDLPQDVYRQALAARDLYRSRQAEAAAP